jgi:hypothetical protein
MFIPISKVDEARRLVYGIATAEVPDKSDEIFDYDSSKPFYKEWSDGIAAATDGKSLGNVREMHSNIAAGKLTQIEFDDEAKQIEVCAKVIDDATWNKVVEGVLTGFSHGGSYERRWTDPNNPKLKRYTAKPSELSLVDNPCVPTATFEYIKADGSVEMRKFITPSNEDSMTTADKGGAAAADNTQPAADAGTDEALLKAAGEAEANGKATDDQKALLAKSGPKIETVKDGKPVKPSAAPMQKWVGSDGQTFDTKREAEIHNLELEKQAELAPAMAKMNALLNDAKPEEKDVVVEKSAATEERLEPAKPEEKAAETISPEKTEKSVKAPLKKGLYGIGQLASILSDINNFMSCAEYEAISEKDDSSIPGQVKAWLKQGAALLNAYCAEETAELFDDEDVEILEMAAKMDAPKAAALAKHVGNAKLKAELEKAGARHSKTDKEALMDLHKSACDHVEAIEKCFKGMGVMPEDSDEDKGAQKMAKLLDLLADEKLEKAALTDLIKKTNTTLEKAADRIEGLEKSKSELAERVENLERQPAAGKGHVKAISKAQDSGGTGDGKATPEKVVDDLSKLSQEERAFVLMKGALSNPVSVVRTVSAK